MKFIYGTNFIELADMVYCPVGNDEYHYCKYNEDFSNIKDNDIVYTNTNFIDHLFKALDGNEKKIKLITHNSDYNINERAVPDYIIKWYSQNVNYRHEKIIPIPIGLENAKWHPDKTPKIVAKLNEKKYDKNLLYVNHNVKTNPKERLRPYEMLKGQGYATLEYGANGRMFDEYIDNIYNHKFVLCPDGNGIDTHRIWECLYLNTIPVVKKGVNTESFSDLPICYVDDWEEINEAFLLNRYRILLGKNNKEKLDFDYWEKLIKS